MMAGVFRVETSYMSRKCSHCKKPIKRGTRHLVSSYPETVGPNYRRNYCKMCVLRVVLEFFKWNVPHKKFRSSLCACGRRKARWMARCEKCKQALQLNRDIWLAGQGGN